MTPPVYIGIDPGQSGAIAAVTADGALVWVEDMPDPLHGGLFSDLVIGENVQMAVVEQVHAMPRQGVSSSFKFGMNYGIVLGALGAMGVPYALVSPAKWKRAVGVTADKNTCRKRACELWPTNAVRFKRAKDGDRAEAALLARWLIDRHPLHLATALGQES